MNELLQLDAMVKQGGIVWAMILMVLFSLRLVYRTMSKDKVASKSEKSEISTYTMLESRVKAMDTRIVLLERDRHILMSFSMKAMAFIMRMPVQDQELVDNRDELLNEYRELLEKPSVRSTFSEKELSS